MKRTIFLLIAGALALGACHRYVHADVYTTGVDVDVHHHHHHHHHHHD